MHQLPATVVLRPGTLADIEQLVPMTNACARETIGHDEITAASFHDEWSDPSMNLHTNTRVAELPGGALVGCAEVWPLPQHAGYWIWARVAPEQRGRGIGTALMDWAEARAAETLDQAPDGARVALVAGGVSSHQPTSELLQDRGFAPIRHSLTMERALDGDLAAPIWPQGIVVRTLQPGQERAVYRVAQESFEDHWGHIKVDEEQDFPIWQHRAINRLGFDPELWFLATDGDEIAGVALCYPEHAGDTELGWIGLLGVRRPWRQRGVGMALLRHAFGELRRRGRTRVGLGVDAASLTGATRLYEQAGMREVQRMTTFEKEIRPGVNLATQELQ